MPYIRQIPGHKSEARREKLDPILSEIGAYLLSQDDTVINASLFEFTSLCCEEWAELFTKRQGKVRYYNFNDEDGVIISAIFEMMRRLDFYNATFPHWSSIALKDDEQKSTREATLRTHARALSALFDADRGEAVGEFNYSLSEIALTLINAKKLTPNEVVQDMFAAMQYFYDREPAAYEDTSIVDPEKGDTKGYLTFITKRS